MRRYVPKGARLVPKEATRVFKGIIYDVYHWQQTMFDGSERTFEMLKRPDTVKVIAIKDDMIMAIEDHQPSYTPRLSLPGGRNDVESEDELACAQRELHEETGMVFSDWKLIDADQRHTKIDSIVYTFIATGFVRQDAPTPDVGGEEITLRPVSFTEAKKIADENASPHYWPNEILRRTATLEDLIGLPELS